MSVEMVHESIFGRAAYVVLRCWVSALRIVAMLVVGWMVQIGIDARPVEWAVVMDVASIIFAVLVVTWAILALRRRNPMLILPFWSLVSLMGDLIFVAAGCGLEKYAHYLMARG